MAVTPVFNGQKSEWDGSEKQNGGKKLNQALEFFRRKVDKIPTPKLREVVAKGLLEDDFLTGQRFYLTPDEVKTELERRDGVALKLAEEMYAAGGSGYVTWENLSPAQRKHWTAAAEFVIEKY